MKYKNFNPSKAHLIAKQALEQIERYVLPPTPLIYELWYVYESGQDTEITRAIDIIIASGHDMTEERCIELYNRHLNTSLESQKALAKAEGLVSDTIQTVANAASKVKNQTASYSDNIIQAATSSGKVKTGEDINLLFEKVLEQAKKMIEENRSLEKELTHKSSIMLQMHQEMENVRKESMTDALTAIANRKLFDIEFYRMSLEAESSRKPLSLLLLDIDFFKSFNDNYGHQVGDQVLKLVARTLKDGVKGRDLPARYGGEEFAVLLPDTKAEDAVRLADILREAVAAKEIINRATGDRLGKITLSVGAAQMGMGEKLSELIERTDAALYRAKSTGRNRVVAADPPRIRRIKGK